MGVAKMGKCAALALILCVALLFGCQAQQTQKPVPLYVNGQPVSEEEFALLDQNVDRAVRMKVLQQLAEECGVADPFSYSEMLAQMEEENQRRAQRAEAGEVVYGLLEYTPLQYYNVLMGDYERAIKDQWIDAAQQSELLAYYEAHIEEYRQIGEITADATVYSDGVLVSERQVALSPITYRTLSEENELLVAMLEDMTPGEVRSWSDEYGMEWTLVCTGRSEDTYASYDEVRGAVTEQWASARLAEELSARAAQSTVQQSQ